MKFLQAAFAAAFFAMFASCNGPATDQLAKPLDASSNSNSIDASKVETDTEGTVRTVIEPGPQAQSKAQEAMILAKPGDVIEFSEGTFRFDGTLSIDGVKDITVRGQGWEKTILNFAAFRSGQGGEGMKIKGNHFTIEDLTIEDTPGDAIKLQDCNDLTIRRIRTWWTGGPATKNGAYGLYPVLSTNVLIENCIAEGASDAGIYVGQSKQVIVRNCRAEKNVAGIEIENCIGADVYNNVAKDNTGGILVFSLPGLTVKNGSDCRVFNNEISMNNHPNFAEPGAIVSTVPPGTGLMIMANDRVEAFGNQFDGNHGASCLVASFLIAQRKFDDAGYDPYPEAIHIHDNTFVGGGIDPKGESLTAYTEATGKPLPDIVLDGIFDSAKLVGGSLPEGLNFSIKDNNQATLINLDLGKTLSGGEPEVSIDPTPFSGSLPPVKAVVIPSAE